jgi:glycosyltransferase 2 family protein
MIRARRPARPSTWRRQQAISAPSVRLALGLGTFGLAALAVERYRVGPAERRLFGVINDLPDGLNAPLWIMMQAGALGAAPVAAAAAHCAGRDRLARRLLLGGTLTWGLSKVVKRLVRRPRPAALIAGTRRRGHDQAGLGFVSGHAGVAAGMCAAVAGDVGPAGRCAAAGAAATVAVARMYIGAHLPLDIIGGAGLGIAVEAALELHDRAASGGP